LNIIIYIRLSYHLNSCLLSKIGKMYSELRKTQMNLSKSQFYGGDGTGRDTYIYNANGGFCPEKKPTRIDDVSK